MLIKKQYVHIKSIHRLLCYMFTRRFLYIIFIILSVQNAYAQEYVSRRSNSTLSSGDVNTNGTVDITDVLLAVDYILGKPTETFDTEAADMNNDHLIDITDVLLIVDKILGKTQEEDDGTPPVDDDDDANPYLPVLAPKIN